MKWKINRKNKTRESWRFQIWSKYIIRMFENIIMKSIKFQNLYMHMYLLPQILMPKGIIGIY